MHPHISKEIKLLQEKYEFSVLTDKIGLDCGRFLLQTRVSKSSFIDKQQRIQKDA